MPVRMVNDTETAGTPGTVGEVARLGAKLGVTAFGGPAAHIAMLQQEVVERRRWIEGRHFVDLLGITNLIPGPNSTEMVMHIGYERAGRKGLAAAGIAFILPAALITLSLAVAYKRYGSTPTGKDFLYGIEPVIVAVVLQAIWRLSKTTVRSPGQLAFLAGIAGLYLAGLSELLLLFGGGTVYVAARWMIQQARSTALFSLAPFALLALQPLSSGGDGAAYSAGKLFLQFLKIGALLYGSGYVLLAFLHNTFVDNYGWLTEQQLLDAVAAGQVTPGPVFSTATFVGYLAGGYTGALLATVAIFLPSFCFVAIANPLLPRIRARKNLSLLLDGVNLAALGLMLGVTWQLGRAAVVDPTTAVIATVVLVLLVWRSVNSALLVGAGALIGLISAAI